MACDLEPQCNFLYRFFTCNLTEETIDVEVTVYTLKGIHTFRRDCSTQASICSPWGMRVRPFLSLSKKIKEYREDRQNIFNQHVPNRQFPNRPMPSPFTKKPKTTPIKRCHMESRDDIRKPRKGNKRCFQHQGFLQAKVVETAPQNFTLNKPALVAIPILQTPTIGTYAQPVTVTAPTQPVATTSGQPQQPQKFCALFMPVGIHCLNNYQLPIHP